MTNRSLPSRLLHAAVGPVLAAGFARRAQAAVPGRGPLVVEQRLGAGLASPIGVLPRVPGIRTGDLELHPGIGGEVGYDSNWFYRLAHRRADHRGNGRRPGEGLPSPRMPPSSRVTPSFYVSTLGPAAASIRRRQHAARTTASSPSRGGVARRPNVHRQGDEQAAQRRRELRCAARHQPGSSDRLRPPSRTTA